MLYKLFFRQNGSRSITSYKFSRSANTLMTNPNHQHLTFQKVTSRIIRTVLWIHLQISFVELRIQPRTYFPQFSVNFLKQIIKQLHNDDRSRTATFYRNHANHCTFNCYVHLKQQQRPRTTL